MKIKQFFIDYAKEIKRNPLMFVNFILWIASFILFAFSLYLLSKGIVAGEVMQ